MSEIADALQQAEKKKIRDRPITVQQLDFPPQKPTLGSSNRRLWLVVGLSIFLLLGMIATAFWFGFKTGKQESDEFLAAYDPGIETAVEIFSMQEPKAEMLPLAVEADTVEDPLIAEQVRLNDPYVRLESGVPFYTVQIVTYQQESQADMRVDVLRGIDHPAFILPGGKYFRICIGAYNSQSDAKEGLGTLKSDFGNKYTDAFIRLVNPTS